MSTVEERTIGLTIDSVTNTNLLHGVSLDTTMSRCKELLVGIESIHERADVEEVIGQVLEIVGHEYYLVPKVGVGHEGEFIENPEPENTIIRSLAELWNSVSSEEPL
jgi:hypothetical protein